MLKGPGSQVELGRKLGVRAAKRRAASQATPEDSDSPVVLSPYPYQRWLDRYWYAKLWFASSLVQRSD